MKFAYSVLLGEALLAADLEYHDCESFQVVCPSCREPVYKGVRTDQVYESESHYLAHYPARLGAAVTDCEHRATQRRLGEVSETHGESRAQRLTYFMDVLRNPLGRSPIYSNGWKRAHYRLDRAHGISEFFSFFAASLDRGFDPTGFFRSVLSDVSWNLTRKGWAINTTFAKHRQEQIALDMWRTLVTPAARSNLKWLFNHAFVTAAAGWAVRERGEDPAERAVALQLTQYMGDIVDVRRDGALALLTTMNRHELPVGMNQIQGVEDDVPSTYLTRLSYSISAEMITALMGMPYFELLREKYGLPGLAYPAVSAPEPATAAARSRHALERELATGEPWPRRS